MKFELITENKNYSKSFLHFLGIFFILALIIILCDIALKLGVISRRFEVEYNCRLLSVEKSKTIFNKLSKLPDLKSKQQIWDFCREVNK